MEELEARYEGIRKDVAALSDFSVQELENSRAVFDISEHQGIVSLEPKTTDIYTLYVGLPVPEDLTTAFIEIQKSIRDLLPPEIRVYLVPPEAFHWEVICIKKPAQQFSDADVAALPSTVAAAVASVPRFDLTFRGFLICPDGAIITRGFGPYRTARTELLDRIPIAARQQSGLGHISLGRIVDPVGPEAFAKLQELIVQSNERTYGVLDCSEATLVHETKWYMVEKDVLAKVKFGSG